jgi:hypothetical protein
LSVAGTLLDIGGLQGPIFASLHCLGGASHDYCDDLISDSTICPEAWAPAPASAEAPIQAATMVTHYRKTTIDGVSIFYREAGPADGPVFLLLHGFPTSSPTA